jgi:chemosensory pili system protein ChpC
MSEASAEVRCLVIPLHERRLLLPNAAVAELIGFREPEPFVDVEPWLLGEVSWHRRSIPVVDFERLIGGEPRIGSVRQRIIVCYAADPGLAWPLVGFIAQGVPRLLRVEQSVIETASRPLHPDAPVLMTLQIEGQSYLVPDVDGIVARCTADIARETLSV